MIHTNKEKQKMHAKLMNAIYEQFELSNHRNVEQKMSHMSRFGLSVRNFDKLKILKSSKQMRMRPRD